MPHKPRNAEAHKYGIQIIHPGLSFVSPLPKFDVNGQLRQSWPEKDTVTRESGPSELKVLFMPLRPAEAQAESEANVQGIEEGKRESAAAPRPAGASPAISLSH